MKIGLPGHAFLLEVILLGLTTTAHCFATPPRLALAEGEEPEPSCADLLPEDIASYSSNRVQSCDQVRAAGLCAEALAKEACCATCTSLDGLKETLESRKASKENVQPLLAPVDEIDANCNAVHLPNVPGLKRICMSYRVKQQIPVTGHRFEVVLGIMGYMPDNKPPTWPRLLETERPISIFTQGTDKRLGEMTSYRFPEEMAHRGFCALTVEYWNHQWWRYTDGQFDMKARDIYCPDSSGNCAGAPSQTAIQVIESRLGKYGCSSTAGIAASGFSQGSHIALFGAKFNRNVGGVLLLGSGHTISFVAKAMSDQMKAMSDQMKYSGASQHWLRKGNSMLRSISGEADGIFSWDDKVLPQQKELTGRDCGECYDCLQEDGSGYYVLKPSENGGKADHEFYTGVKSTGVNEYSSSSQFMCAWQNGTGDGAMPASFNWLARTAHNDVPGWLSRIKEVDGKSSDDWPCEAGPDRGTHPVGADVRAGNANLCASGMCLPVGSTGGCICHEGYNTIPAGTYVGYHNGEYCKKEGRPVSQESGGYCMGPCSEGVGWDGGWGESWKKCCSLQVQGIGESCKPQARIQECGA
jgi:hypothetical protein